MNINKLILLSFELPPHHVPRVASQWQAPEARERIIFCILSGFGHLSIFDWRAGERTGGREQKTVPLEIRRWKRNWQGKKSHLFPLSLRVFLGLLPTYLLILTPNYIYMTWLYWFWIHLKVGAMNSILTSNETFGFNVFICKKELIR